STDDADGCAVGSRARPFVDHAGVSGGARRGHDRCGGGPSCPPRATAGVTGRRCRPVALPPAVPGCAVWAGIRVSTTDQVGGEAPAEAGGLYQGARPAGRARPGSSPSVLLLRQFPPRALTANWPATGTPRAQVMTWLMADPFLGGSATGLRNRRRGLIRVLDWLERQPGDTWQN